MCRLRSAALSPNAPQRSGKRWSVQHALLVIENLNTVTVNANVAEKDVARVQVGQTVGVTVPAYPQQTFSGVVQSIAGRVDEKTRALSGALPG